MRDHQVTLHIPKRIKDAVWGHLLPQDHEFEEAAFVYAQAENDKDTTRLDYVDWEPIPPSGFSHRSQVYMELTNDTKAAVIKRAHDLKASLVELHSHTRAWPAEFSPSDLQGFREFVPHVFWRLERRPYLAFVVTRSGFDAVAWITSPTSAEPIDAIRAGREVLRPTGQTLLRQRVTYERRQI